MRKLKISRGQAAENLNQQAGENRNAWLKLKQKGGENMKNDEKKDTLYLCDPQKNTACPKEICQMPNGCFFTTKKEFAKDEKSR